MLSEVKTYKQFDWFCVFLADAFVEDLEPETRYKYRTYVSVNNKKYFSRTTQEFETRGLTGLWIPNGPYMSGAPESFITFSEGPFSFQPHTTILDAFSTIIDGDTITFKEWPVRPPYYLGCGGEKSFLFVGKINSDWSHITGSLWGFSGWDTTHEGCIGYHRHNGNPSSHELTLVPVKYKPIQ